MLVDGQADPAQRNLRFAMNYFTTRDKGTMRLHVPVTAGALQLELLAPCSSRTLTSAVTLYPTSEPGVYEGAFDWSCIDFSDASEFVDPEGKDAVPDPIHAGDSVFLVMALSTDDGSVVAARDVQFRYLPAVQ